MLLKAEERNGGCGRKTSVGVQSELFSRETIGSIRRQGWEAFLPEPRSGNWSARNWLNSKVENALSGEFAGQSAMLALEDATALPMSSMKRRLDERREDRPRRKTNRTCAAIDSLAR